MTENLPQFISIVFILTTFLTVGFLFYAIKQTVYETVPAKLVIFLIPFWLFFQSILSLGGFYQPATLPPRMPLFAVLPAILLIISLFIFARKSFIEPLPLKILTLLSVIRIPVELVLYWLAEHKAVPQIMTFAGWNFDILSGITAPFIFWLAFRNGKVNRKLLIAWNIFGLALLINIVSIAILSLQSPIQRFAFEQPNRAVLYFPFIWLPAVVVPIVLFSHLASFWILFKKR
jgi:hypothetical protein